MSIRALPQKLWMAAILASVITGVIVVALTTTMADDWPQWRGPKRDGVWRESGIVETSRRPS